MQEFTHWHPVYLSENLKEKPVSIKLNNFSIVLFRNKNKTVSALVNECPHRRMKLSEGKVEEDRIVCPYHGWKISKSGNCTIPSGGEQKSKHPKFTAFEIHGVIWIRLLESETGFPIFDIEDLHHISTVSNVINSPLEIVLDNFTETEHTSSVHALLGYDSEDLPNIEIELTTKENSVRLYNRGKQKKIPFIVRSFLDINKNDKFIDDWTTYFSPIYTVYDQYWEDSKTGEKRKNFLKIYVFFNPIDKDNTEIFAFTFMKYNKLGKFGLNLLVKPSMKYIVDLEVGLDKQMIEKIENKETSLSGQKLSKFDKALGPNRSKIKKIYYGR
ncbi:MAG: Rieske 2Fe-2S domain-containing protein [Leptospiraceae bacterium]|nr:Rieske 2Fe-2S domain-containing protein [Leptospiraceae bacterium]